MVRFYFTCHAKQFAVNAPLLADKALITSIFHKSHGIMTDKLPNGFVSKKAQILAEITDHDSENYNDKSPKGTIDTEIIDVINEINAFDKYVTTSSCAGRVAVFVEGHKPALPSTSDHDTNEGVAVAGAGPGGKGHGNKWLFVSHEPVDQPHGDATGQSNVALHKLFGLEVEDSKQMSAGQGARLIKLSFSPLILHILCADLQAAKPLLAAAINAGFRESGVHSLKALDDPGTGVMVGIRTAGLVFETVIGYVAGTGQDERYESCVSEAYLRMCFNAVNERFEWNIERKERLRRELQAITTRACKNQREDRDARRERKRAEGLQKQKETDKSKKNDDVELYLATDLG